MNEVSDLKGVPVVKNPFGTAQIEQKNNNVLGGAESSRTVAEIQAACVMAMQNPRNPQIAVNNILIECQRESLANSAIYEYARGGTSISGASIRLAEVIKRHWKNIRSGWRQLERNGLYSTLQAYAYDIENNVLEERVFEVKHWRDTKKGGYELKDERDIYELQANKAARRVRACILSLIPGDVIETCIKQCEETLKAKADTSPEAIALMLTKMEKFNVNKAMIEARLQRNIDSITPAQLVKMRSIYNSLQEGIATVGDFFDKSLMDESSKKDDQSVKEQVKKQIQEKDETEKIINDYVLKIESIKSVTDLDNLWNDEIINNEVAKDKRTQSYKKLDAVYLAKRDDLENQTKEEEHGQKTENSGSPQSSDDQSGEKFL